MSTYGSASTGGSLAIRCGQLRSTIRRISGSIASMVSKLRSVAGWFLAHLALGSKNFERPKFTSINIGDYCSRRSERTFPEKKGRSWRRGYHGHGHRHSRGVPCNVVTILLLAVIFMVRIYQGVIWFDGEKRRLGAEQVAKELARAEQDKLNLASEAAPEQRGQRIR